MVPKLVTAFNLQSAGALKQQGFVSRLAIDDLGTLGGAITLVLSQSTTMD